MILVFLAPVVLLSVIAGLGGLVRSRVSGEPAPAWAWLAIALPVLAIGAPMVQHEWNEWNSERVAVAHHNTAIEAIDGLEDVDGTDGVMRSYGHWRGCGAATTTVAWPIPVLDALPHPSEVAQTNHMNSVTQRWAAAERRYDAKVESLDFLRRRFEAAGWEFGATTTIAQGDFPSVDGTNGDVPLRFQLDRAYELGLDGSEIMLELRTWNSFDCVPHGWTGPT